MVYVCSFKKGQFCSKIAIPSKKRCFVGSGEVGTTLGDQIQGGPKSGKGGISPKYQDLKGLFFKIRLIASKLKGLYLKGGGANN